MSPSSRRRVLVIAEACNPDWVSGHLVGWSHYRALSRVADTHLVTQARNQAALEARGLRKGVDFSAFSHASTVDPLFRLAVKLGGEGKGWTYRTAAYSLAFPAFERLWWQAFKSRLQDGEFDLVHQLTPLSPTTRLSAPARCRSIGVPFVWGPINGGAPWPKGFDAVRRREREWLSYVRGGYKLLPGYRRSRRRISAIIVGSRHTWEQLPRFAKEKAVYLPENAIDGENFNIRSSRIASLPLRFVYLGRLVPYKGADMALEAIRPALLSGAATFTLYGDGPLKEDLLAKARQLPGVSLPGWIDHAQVRDVLADADVLLFPSIREFGGAVALEAMAVGVPPIVVDYAGPAEIVTPETGWLIKMGSRAEIVRSLAETIHSLTKHPAVIDAKRHAAAQLAHSRFTWSAKAQKVRQVWDWALGEAERPSWRPPGVL